ELERTRKVKGREEYVPQEPSSVTPEKESGKAPREGSYNVPSEESKPRAPIKEIKFASRVNGEAHLAPQALVGEMAEVDEEMAVEEPEVELQEIWRGLVKILSLGLF
ncbi:MAG: hypothetical protein ACE5JO_03225, partial [Candidatus Binatia bacterium]